MAWRGRAGWGGWGGNGLDGGFGFAEVEQHTVELAKSSRSKCKICFRNIEVGLPRVGEWLENEQYGGYYKWHHVGCYPFRTQGITSTDTLSGFRSLPSDSKTLVTRAVASGGGRVAATPPASPAERLAWQAPSPARPALGGASGGAGSRAGPSSPGPAPPSAPGPSPGPGAGGGAGGAEAGGTQQERERLSERLGGSLTQEEAAQRAASEVPLSTINLTIVGLQHYRGVAHMGEYVTLVREPSNPYDGNAVRVDNLEGEQVGHLKREMAAALAPVMDDGRVRVEATIPRPGGAYNMKVHVIVYGDPADAAVAALAPYMDRLAIYTDLPPPRAPPSQPRHPAAVTSVQSFQPVDSQKELDRMFDELDAGMQSLDFDPGRAPALRAHLYPYQRQGVAWMLKRETQPDDLPPFWEKREELGVEVYFNQITASSKRTKPEQVLGGLLADDMGLGKTVHVLALIAGNPAPGTCQPPALPPPPAPADPAPPAAAAGGGEGGGGPALSDAARILADMEDKVLKRMKVADLRALLESVGQESTGRKPELLERLTNARDLAASMIDGEGEGEGEGGGASTSTPTPPPASEAAAAGGVGGGGDGRRPTLVVCPLSVLFNWESQAEAHYHEGSVRVYTYHGQDRNADVAFLSQFDLVITTYSTLSAELSAHGGDTHAIEGMQRLAEQSLAAGAAAVAEEGAGGAGGGGGEGEAGGDAKGKKPRGKKAKAEKKLKRKRGADGDAAAVAAAGAGGVLAVPWRRVVLDEAHAVRNSNTKAFKAVGALSATHRWCLTGTPLQNKAEDVQALFSFLRVTPVDNPSIWTRAIGRPVREGDATGLARLRVLMKAVTLRRTKALLGTMLPPKQLEVHKVKMGPQHQEAYDALHASCKAAVDMAMREGDDALLRMYQSVLECLTRLRQVCCSISMVPTERLEAARKAVQVAAEKAKSKKALGADEAKFLFEVLSGALADPARGSADAPECAICLDSVDETKARILRKCRHAFCVECLSRMVAMEQHRTQHKCPMCRDPFQANDILDLVELKTSADASSSQPPPPEPAALPPEEPVKVTALLQALGAHLSDATQGKAVVFSQFTTFLDVIGAALVSHGVVYCRVDGRVSAEKRRQQLRLFDDPAGPRVMLVSMRAGGEGLNLTTANRVFLMDSWWNSAVEMQAMDRVHRLGQTRPITVVKYVCEGTVEERILEIQEAKLAMARGVLTKPTAEEARRDRINNLRRIFS